MYENVEPGLTIGYSPTSSHIEFSTTLLQLTEYIPPPRKYDLRLPQILPQIQFLILSLYTSIHSLNDIIIIIIISVIIKA